MTRTDVSALIRATLFVRDLDRATHFYRRLGLSETYYEGVLEHPSACSIIGFDQCAPLAIRILKRPGPNYGMIGLFRMDDSLNAQAVPLASGPARIGEVALIFYVPELRDRLALLKDAGALWARNRNCSRWSIAASWRSASAIATACCSIWSKMILPSRSAHGPKWTMQRGISPHCSH